MKLFDYVRSSAAYRVRIALNLKQMDYEQIPVNLLEGAQRGEQNLARNPQGLVPSFEDADTTLNQSMAICEYLDDAYPESYRLLPDAPLEKARVRSLAQLIACDIHPVNNLRVLKYLVGELGATEEQKLSWYRHWITLGFEALEEHLNSEQSGKFCHGDEPTLADLCLVPQVFNARRFETDLSRFPRVVEIADRCNDIDAFIKASPDNQ